VALKRICA